MNPVFRISRILGPWLLLCHASCAIPLVLPEPVGSEASAAFARAVEVKRVGALGWQREARRMATLSLLADSEWVAPQRFLDDLERDDLLGHAALGKHLERLAQNSAPGDFAYPTGRSEGFVSASRFQGGESGGAQRVRMLHDRAWLDAHQGQFAAAAYLAGRLEGIDGAARFHTAEPGGPQNAWMLHGRAWLEGQRGRYAAAVKLERRALGLARDGWEKTYFALSGARYSAAADRSDEALQWLNPLYKYHDINTANSLRLELALAPLEMRNEHEEMRLRGYWRALSILHREPLKTRELRTLLAPIYGLIAMEEGSSNLAELQSALAAFDNPARTRLRARLLFDRGARSIALEMIGPPAANETKALRAERIARGNLGELLERWLAELPAQVLAEDGLPRRASLRQLIVLAREASDPEQCFALGEALLVAGWFAEAQALANGLATEGLDRALELERRATAGRSVLQGITGLFRALDRGHPYAGPQRRGTWPRGVLVREDSTKVHSLSDLLSSLQPLFQRHLSEESLDFDPSPRLSFGPFATLLLPGPRFSQRDQERGLGQAGDPVPGLAASLASIGRFGVFGTVLGNAAPDGVLLRVLASEEIAGSHLGVPFSGNRVWCQGADLGSRPSRLGASISGAAVHEGYWIDVQEVRQALQRWHSLEARFFADKGLKARRALLALGPRLPSVLAAAAKRGSVFSFGNVAEHRKSAYAALGEADRIRLAVLTDRRAALAAVNKEPGSSMTIEELLEVTARHEEGHLTDQTRFLPLADHFFKALGFLAHVGFSAQRMGEELEYRAQLICLAVSADPRLPLAESVQALEGGSELTPHAAAYRRLVLDLLATLESTPAICSQLDSSRYWIHQLHHLKPEQVRALALALARQKGLVRGD